MFKNLKVYLPFTRSVIQTMMSYRLNFFMYIFGEFILVFVLFYIWKAVYASSPSDMINGFTFVDMISYLFISNITALATGNGADFSVGDEVRTGDIAMSLIKPISYRGRILASELGGTSYAALLCALPIWIGFSIYMHSVHAVGMPGIMNILFYILSLVLGYGILFLFNFMFGLSAFFVTYIWGFIFVKGTIVRFFSGQLTPLAFFPSVVQRIFNFLPFSSMLYTPSMIYLGKYSTTEMFKMLGLQALWLIIMIVLSNLLWKKAMKKITIMGG